MFMTRSGRINKESVTKPLNFNIFAQVPKVGEMVTKDTGIRPSTPEQMAKLKAAFVKVKFTKYQPI